MLPAGTLDTLIGGGVLKRINSVWFRTGGAVRGSLLIFATYTNHRSPALGWMQAGAPICGLDW